MSKDRLLPDLSGNEGAGQNAFNTLGVPCKGLLQGLFLNSFANEVLYGASERVFVKAHLVDGVKGSFPLTQVRLVETGSGVFFGKEDLYLRSLAEYFC